MTRPIPRMIDSFGGCYSGAIGYADDRMFLGLDEPVRAVTVSAPFLFGGKASDFTA